jgi:4-diphosphocytidyl-2-C-methyl-D-erythritol kinase
MSLRLFAPAKVNLTLRVGRAHADGRHPLDSLVGFTQSVGDFVTLAKADSLKLSIEGPFAGGLTTGNDNLIMRAGAALQAFAGVSNGAEIVLTKNLPLASGIGGGSADCAAALTGLNKLWDLGLSDTQLLEIGSGLGADVPACVAGFCLRMTGTGEVIAPISGSARMGIVLVNTGIPCPTGPVYNEFDRLGDARDLAYDPLPSLRTQQDLLAFLRQSPNDLEAAACALVPEIRRVLAAIQASPNVLLARMSGSGATCFGLYANIDAARLGGVSIKKTLAFDPVWVEADEIN